jgi:dynactin-4
VARGAMLPRRKPLMNKRSRRCPKCNVIIIKPELNPSSTVFRKYLVAMDLLPTLRARWEGMARTHAVICIVNPAALAMTLRLGLSPTFRTTVGDIALPEEPIALGEFSEIEAHDERVSARCADDPEYVLDRAGNLVLLRLRVMQLPTDIAAPGEAEFIGLRCELGYTSDQGNGVSITFDAKLEIVE